MDYLGGNEKQGKWVKKWMSTLLSLCYNVDISNYRRSAFNSLIITHRTSIRDVLLLACCLPGQLTFVLPLQLCDTLWGRLLRRFTDIIAIDPTTVLSTRSIIKAIKTGRPCVIFLQDIPGFLEYDLRFYERFSLLLQKLQTEVISIHLKGSKRDKLFPQIIARSLSSELFIVPDHDAVQPHIASMRLFRLISDLAFVTGFQPQTLFTALLQGVRKGIAHRATIEDANPTLLTYRQFLIRCFVLGRQIKNQTKQGEYVGVMMPTSIAGMVTFFALQAYKRIPAMLNFSTGFHNLFSACSVAGIKIIYTSRQFIAIAQLESLIDELQSAGLKIVFLEDLKNSIHLRHRCSGLIKAMFPHLTYKCLGKKSSPEQVALILFTSGSEGTPKGVALSHINLLANCHQMISRVDFTAKDVFFNCLPIFHTFGLTAGSIIPLITGTKCFFYPSPLHYKIIPGCVRKSGATIMFGTDTFLMGYARAAEKHDFSKIRYIFAGAEKVKPETLKYWREMFGVSIYEGYGATEASPVISLNCPLASIPGTVGMVLPTIASRIDPVEGIAEGGRLVLHGPNIMLGYLNPDAPWIINAPCGGWHDTGDIVTMTTDGFITIAGRAKRFAKIAGEMVSLSVVEGIAASVWPEILHAAVIGKSSAKGGEQILLFSEAAHADKASFIKKIKEEGYSELFIPHLIYSGSTIPVLSSGKIDYVMLDKLLLEERQIAEEL
ncbi:AMP-binding protein [Legionella fallonii]|uniref:AMP-dependent synthetase/ligase domain-containing protein n=1 Tax=Legionella fallonii LLAP-10 TaxID=1212491 RepID=A0A098G9P2_9GAMM|nr:AMP-binding protein [Legionella fallonii]CEG58715.1 conserved protein of unknown function [Legionella fallonii LLAP-10]